MFISIPYHSPSITVESAEDEPDSPKLIAHPDIYAAFYGLDISWRAFHATLDAVFKEVPKPLSDAVLAINGCIAFIADDLMDTFVIQHTIRDIPPLISSVIRLTTNNRQLNGRLEEALRVCLYDFRGAVLEVEEAVARVFPKI